jgi:ATPase subunit of ABC transporter with duplicated ATPase domains
VESLHDHGLDRAAAMRSLDRYELVSHGDQDFATLSGGQQARFLILLLEIDGATLLLLDEPTDNLDVHSADALERGLDEFEGTVIAVTHDRWFARRFNRFVIVGENGVVTDRPAPAWE